MINEKIVFLNVFDCIVEYFFDNLFKFFFLYELFVFLSLYWVDCGSFSKIVKCMKNTCIYQKQKVDELIIHPIIQDF